MSAVGYASRLSQNHDRGRLNLKNEPDDKLLIARKAEHLVSIIRSSKHVIVHTGAGISTAAGIADFRGPDGVWTLEKKRKRQRISAPATAPQTNILSSPLHNDNNIPNVSDHFQPENIEKGDAFLDFEKDLHQPSVKTDASETTAVDFEIASPSLTHMVLVEMQKEGYLKHIISQNVDGLHLRSGFPVDYLAEVHGNVFLEICSQCESRFFRQYEIKQVGFQETGAFCSKCQAPLTDFILDWNDPLPEKDHEDAIYQSEIADLAICIGTSFQMNPARNWPLKTLRNQGLLVIVNLSKTDRDTDAVMTIRAKADLVFALVANLLGLKIPKYKRVIPFRVEAACNWNDTTCVLTLVTMSELGRMNCFQGLAFRLIYENDSYPPQSRIESAWISSRDFLLSHDSFQHLDQIEIRVLLHPFHPSPNSVIPSKIQITHKFKNKVTAEPSTSSSYNLEILSTSYQPILEEATNLWNHCEKVKENKSHIGPFLSSRRKLDCASYFCKSLITKRYYTCMLCFEEIYVQKRVKHLEEVHKITLGL